jgi:hypothetical protein
VIDVTFFQDTGPLAKTPIAGLHMGVYPAKVGAIAAFMKDTARREGDYGQQRQ